MLFQLFDESRKKLMVLLSERRLSLATSDARGGSGLVFLPEAIRVGTLVQGANAVMTHA